MLQVFLFLQIKKKRLEILKIEKGRNCSKTKLHEGSLLHKKSICTRLNKTEKKNTKKTFTEGKG